MRSRPYVQQSHADHSQGIRANPDRDVEKVEGLPIGWICDSNGRKGVIGSGILTICNNTRFVGTAFTVSCAAADNLGFHVALKFIQPGDVLVVKGEEFGESAVTRDLMIGMAQNSGLRAFIIDTHIRDLDWLEPLNIKFFAKGLNPNGSYKAGLGKIGLPILICGYIVEFGALIVGDADNVAVVKCADIDAVLADLAGTSEKVKGSEASITEVQKFMEIADEALASVQVKWVN